MPRRRIVWTDAEKDRLICTGQEILAKAPRLSVLEVLRRSQEKVLPVSRHRNVIAASFVPWFDEGLRQKPAIPQHVPVSTTPQTEPPALDMEVRLVGKITSPILSKLDEIERLLFRLAANQGGDPIATQVWSSPATQSLPRVCVVGPTNQQAAILQQSVKDRINLTIITKARAQSGPLPGDLYDRVVLWSKFLSHAICGRIAKNYPKEAVVLHHGGINRLIEIILSAGDTNGKANS